MSISVPVFLDKCIVEDSVFILKEHLVASFWPPSLVSICCRQYEKMLTNETIKKIIIKKEEDEDSEKDFKDVFELAKYILDGIKTEYPEFLIFNGYEDLTTFIAAFNHKLEKDKEDLVYIDFDKTSKVEIYKLYEKTFLEKYHQLKKLTPYNEILLLIMAGQYITEERFLKKDYYCDF